EYSLEWWVRHPVSLTARFTDEVICKEDRSFVSTGSQIVNGTSIGDAGPIDLRIEVYSRSSDADGRLRLITVCLVNRTHGTAYGDESCLFQSSFRASVVSPDTNRLILPYPEAPESAALLDPEEEGLRLLYRNAATFATGHGSAAD